MVPRAEHTAPAGSPARIFDRFHQADPSSKRGQDGLGLGLSIVQNLVDLHGGRIHAESRGEGQGAIFTVVLPCAQGRGGGG